MGAEQIEYFGACRQVEAEGLQPEHKRWDVIAAVEVDLDVSNGGLF